MAGYRVLDIETIPDLDVWAKANEPRFKLAPRGEFQMSTEDALAGRTDGPLIAPAAVTLDDVFAPPYAHRVVAMSWVNLKGGEDERYHYDGHHSACIYTGEGGDEDSEWALLDAFSQAQHGDNAMLVTWNGRGFDLPVLSLRSLKRGVPFEFYYNDRDMRYRYSEAGHFDLMDWLGDYGAARNMGLGDIARLIGLPGKVGEVSGASVKGMLGSRPTEAARKKVAAYCLSDTLQTALIFLRTRVHCGRIGVSAHNKALATFEDSDVGKEAGIKIDWGNLELADSAARAPTPPEDVT